MLASNSAHERHANSKKRSEIPPRQPVAFVKFVRVATFCFIRSVVIRTMVDVGWIGDSRGNASPLNVKRVCAVCSSRTLMLLVLHYNLTNNNGQS